MPKVITQETFDAAVKENMEEFDMSAEEAIEDATQQFEAQGVNLANIIKDLSLHAAGDATDAKHPVVEAVENLNAVVNADPFDAKAASGFCAQIREECDKDIAHRVLAGKNEAYLVLYNMLDKNKADPEMLQTSIDTLSSLCNGQPDLIDMRGIMLLMDLLGQNLENENMGLRVVKLIRLNCIRHEDNRQAFVKRDLITQLMAFLENNKANPEIVKETCFSLRILTFDDDVRVPFGKAHDHAKMIVTETGALKKILDICNDYVSNRPVLGELYATLSCLAVRNEFCQEVLDLGGIAMMLNTLEKNIDHQQTVKQVFTVLKALAGNDEVKRVIVESGGVELILAAMTQHAKAPVIQELGCAAIATISLRNPTHCLRVMTNNGAEVILKSMQLHPGEMAVQKQSCMAVRNLVARTREHCPAFVQLGVEDLIQQAIARHPSCRDEAKAALRDLDLKVDLQCRWKGEGKGIKY